MVGRITLVVGLLVVVALAVAGLRMLDDAGDRDGDGSRGLPAADCPPQPRRAAALRARRAFMAQYVRSDAEWFSGVGVVAARGARRTASEAAGAGGPVAPLPPADWRRGLALLVTVDPSADLPELPGCIAATPVVYAGAGPPRGG